LNGIHIVDKNIALDLANETLREYGDLPPDFAEKMVKRIRRKFAVKIEQQDILEHALYYKEVYAFGKSIFKQFLGQQHGKYASSEDVDIEKLIAALVQKYPHDDLEILQNIVGALIYYEHLR